MKIAIVDDIPEDLANTVESLRKYFDEKFIEEKSIDVELEEFNTPQNFLKRFDSTRFDIVLLDIIMEEMNGIEVAQKIREKDRECKIIFVTSSKDFLLDGYSVFATGYFLKPIREHEGDLRRTFEFILQKFFERDRSIQIHAIGNVDLDIPFKEILYVDISANHKVRIVTVNQEILTTMNFSECQQILMQDSRFLECHYRIIINMDQVQSMKAEDFILSNGVKVPMSQRYRRESKLTYMNYLLHKND